MIIEIHKSSLSSHLIFTKQCWKTRSKAWSIQIISKKFKQKLRTLQEHSWSNGSLTSIGNSDWHQNACMLLFISSINSWVERRYRKINFIYLVFQLYSWLPSMKKSTHQSSEIFLRCLRINSLNRPFCKWKKIFFMHLTSSSQVHLPTDSCKDIEEWV